MNAGIDSLMVFSGAHGKKDLVAAGVQAHPSYIGADVSALLRPPRIATLDQGGARCGTQQATIDEGAIRLRRGHRSRGAPRCAVGRDSDGVGDPELAVDDALAQLTLLD